MLNYSNLSTENQNKLLDNIESNSSRERDYILHVLIFQYISFQPGMSKFLFVSDNHQGSVISQYIDHLISDNITELITFDDPDDICSVESDYIRNFCIEKADKSYQFDLILLPADELRIIIESQILKIDELLTPNGVLIVYGKRNIESIYSLNRIGCYEVDSTTFCVYQKTAPISNIISEKVVSIIDTIKTSDLEDKNCLKHLISYASQLEMFIQKNRDEYKLHFMCYHINELKNALLNIYVSETFDSILEFDLFAAIDQLEMLIY